MPSIDMPIEQLRQYKPSQYREPDFEDFWDSTVGRGKTPAAQCRINPLQPAGQGGGMLRGPLRRVRRRAHRRLVSPPGRVGRFPGVCVYHGYSNRAARPLDLLHLAAQGVCVLSMDCRGQNGQSQDANVYPEGHYLGWMTQGIRDPRTYVYRYIYADALRALELLAGRDEVDPDRLIVTGLSQGGGISLAVVRAFRPPGPVAAGRSLPLRFSPGHCSRPGRALPGDPRLSQGPSPPVRADDPHTELFRQHQPGIVDPLPDGRAQLPLGRHLPAQHDLRAPTTTSPRKSRSRSTPSTSTRCRTSTSETKFRLIMEMVGCRIGVRWSRCPGNPPGPSAASPASSAGPALRPEAFRSPFPVRRASSSRRL